MDVIITNDSALEFWRLHRRSRVNFVFRKCLRKPPCESSISTVLHHVETWNLTMPLDIMVGEKGSRRPSKAILPHVCSNPLPDNAILEASNGLYVISPELCFFQMAGRYSLAELIALGNELCGSYSLPPIPSAGIDQDVSNQPLYNLPKLTNVKKLKAFAARMEGWLGYRLALKALQYIADDSASPMETILFILLTLPYRYGGFALPAPELNGRIDPEYRMARFSGGSFYRGDLLWRSAKTVVEYDSDMEHTGPDRIASDAIRRNDLALCGFTEITVTKSQVQDPKLLEKIARQIAARIGKELRYKNPAFAKTQSGLYRALF